MSKTVLVTGSRDFTDRQMIFAVLKLHRPSIVIHGNARGADELAAEWCRAHPNVYEIAVPAKWNLLGRRAGPERNKMMLCLNPTVVLAFFRTSAPNRGTKGMVALAQAAAVPIESFWS